MITLVAASCSSTYVIGCPAQTALPVPLADNTTVALVLLRLKVREVAAEEGDNVVSLEADEARGVVVLGVRRVTLELCDTVERRFGPLVEVVTE
jgi:hypothetical protein